MKDLPHVFRGEVKENTNSNMEYTRASEEKKNTLKIDKTIPQKINDIFSSNSYVYKSEVIIKTKDKTLTKQLVGKNKDNLITLDNELIPLDQIIDIYPK